MKKCYWFDEVIARGGGKIKLITFHGKDYVFTHSRAFVDAVPTGCTGFVIDGPVSQHILLENSIRKLPPEHNPFEPPITDNMPVQSQKYGLLIDDFFIPSQASYSPTFR